MGLTSEEAAALLKEYGENTLLSDKKAKPLRIFLGQFRDVMVMILLIAAGISAFIGETADAVTIIIIVMLNAILGFIQEYRTEKTLLALKSMSAPIAKVCRDGHMTVIPASQLVPGDIISVEAGDKVAADAVLLIAAVLDDNRLKTLFNLAKSLGLDVLGEAHDENEVRRLVSAGFGIIGVNNRNLKTFEVSLENTRRLSALVPENAVFVCESGIKDNADMRFAKSCGADAVLIGETLMRSDDKKKALETLNGEALK